jgi:hypothetical protein
LVGALLAAVFIAAATAPAYGQASRTPLAEPQPVDTTPEGRDTVPETKQEQEKPEMQWEEQTLFASIQSDDVELLDVRSIGA